MKNNEELQREVQDAIKWEPSLHAAEIGVTAKEGIITLTGTVDSYAKKAEAESATKNVKGVKAVVENIEVKLGNWGKKSDSDIASEIVNSFMWNWKIPSDKVQIKVENGWVTLEGELNWNYQREAIRTAVGNLIGIIGVTNNVRIRTESQDKVEQKAVESAIARNGFIDDEDVEVLVKDNKVTLVGTVTSWAQKEEAERMAWNAPGVEGVDNRLVVEYEYLSVE